LKNESNNNKKIVGIKPAVKSENKKYQLTDILEPVLPIKP
jgi:hypothetical protein